MNKVKYGKIIFDLKEEKDICNKYLNGKSLSFLAKMYNISDLPIKKLLIKNNITLRDNREKSLKYICNEQFFHDIDTEEKAYWLGFIYADGYIQSSRKNSNKKLGISLSTKDKEHLEKFKSSINSNHIISEYEVKNGYKIGNKYVRILISSIILTNDLISKGVLEHKTEILKFPTEDIINKDLIHHFIRGYLDGDGSITKSKNAEIFTLQFCGTREFLQGVQEYFDLNSKLEKRHKNAVNNYSLKICGNRQVEMLLDIIYNNANIYLDRKYNRYIELKELNVTTVEKILNKKAEKELEKGIIISKYHEVKNAHTLSKMLGISKTKVLDILHEKDEKIYLKNQIPLNKENEILDLYNQGCTRTKIRKITNLDHRTIVKILNKNGIIEKEKEIDNNIFQLFNQGKNKSEIHRITGKSRDYIRKILNSN